MTALHPSPASFAAPDAPAAALDLPAWVERLFARCEHQTEEHSFGPLRRRSTDGISLASAGIPAGTSLAPQAFQRTIRDAYTALHAALAATPARHPVRVWNFIPSIHMEMGRGLDRYRAFNLARFDAFRDLGLADRPPPTATGIGHAARDFSIHVLALSTPGEPIENPRQVPAYRYSERFGPRPPCFSRAMLVHDLAEPGPRLLVGGTASVRGEDSLWEGDLHAQLREIAENLRALLRVSDPPGRDPAAPHTFTSLRAYVRRASDAGGVRAFLRGFAPGAELEVRSAEICRPELMVEIEGVVLLPAPERPG